MLDERIAVSRRAKALAIADACRRHGYTVDQVVHFDAAERMAMEAAAHVRPASDETWRRVGGLLAGASDDPCPWCAQGDPEGIVGEPRNYGHSGPCVR